MNLFDATVYIIAFIAVIAGFYSGFLRSAVTILAYVAAMPIAMGATSLLSPALAGQSASLSYSPWARNSFLFFGIFLVIGVVLGSLLRLAVSETVGPRISIADRLAGSALGAVRIGLVAVVMVLVFDRLIPPDREPAFLRGSQLRPILSKAGADGPEIPAAGDHGIHRSVEEGSADVKRPTLSVACVANAPRDGS